MGLRRKLEETGYKPPNVKVLKIPRKVHISSSYYGKKPNLAE